MPNTAVNSVVKLLTAVEGRERERIDVVFVKKLINKKICLNNESVNWALCDANIFQCGVYDKLLRN